MPFILLFLWLDADAKISTLKAHGIYADQILKDRIDIQQDLLCALTCKAGLERPYGYCTDSK